MKRIYVTLVFVAAVCWQVAAQNEDRILSADSLITMDGRLDSLYRSLPEVMVVGERPIVKAMQGKLIYDLPRLLRNLAVDNAYDAVKELPGVTEMNDNLTLGGKSVTVVLDGKVTTMTPEQLNTLLKSIPASRIEKAEVMYSAPARYQVRGAMINICLKQGDSGAASLQGEIFSDYRQKHYENLTERASLLYSGHKFSVDFLYSYSHGRNYFLTDKKALHTLSDGTIHPMNTNESQKSRFNRHNLRLGGDYLFADDHQLSLTYNAQFMNGFNLSTVNGTQTSNARTRMVDQLHNGRIDYHTPFGMKAGVEYTYYHSPSSQLLHSRLEGDELNFRSSDSQRINRWKLFLSQEHELPNGWGVNYGAVYTTSLDNSYQYYYNSENDNMMLESNNMKSRRREQTLNFYAGFNKSFGDNLSLDASLAAEQFHTTVWNEWSLYPAFNLNYTPAPGNVWQLSLSSDKSYPDYWATQNAVSYMGGEYSEFHGNPYLKPEINYQLQLTYILKSKYIFNVWYSHTKDNATQTLYQSPDRLVEIYKYFNFDFEQQAGIQAVVPFTIGRWLSSRFTLTGVYDRQKDSDFWNIPFDRKVYYAMLNMNHTLTLSSRPDLRLIVNGMMRSKAIQGIYDLPVSGNVDVALRYTFAGGKALFTFRCNDLFETAQISPRIRYATQNVTNHYSAFRELGISFTYKFGGYKEKKREGVDTSRFK